MHRPRIRDYVETALGFFLGVVILVLLAIALASCARAQVPPELQALTDETWHADLPPRTVFYTESGDSALVLTDDHRYIRARVRDTTWVVCSSIGAPAFSLDDLKATADSVLHGHAPYDGNSLWTRRTECISFFRHLADSLQTD